MIRLGFVEYLNALPFYLPFQLGYLQPKASLTFDVPTSLNQQLREKKLDIALTSSVAYFDGPYQLLPGFCIAAHKKILSVNLYLQDKLKPTTRIALTPQSATSVDLLKVICTHFWKVNPQFVSEKPYDGFLLIGDDALKNVTMPGYQTIDLAKVWYQATHLPFVFALFAMRENLCFDPSALEAALEWSEYQAKLVVQEAARRSGLDRTLLYSYYTLCHYRLEEKEKQGLNLFKYLRENVS